MEYEYSKLKMFKFKSFRVYLGVGVLVAFVFYSSAYSQDKFVRDCKRSIVEFERLHWGLQFESRGRFGPDSVTHYFCADSGDYFKVLTVSKSERGTLRIAHYVDLPRGYLFNSQKRDPEPDSDPISPHTVNFVVSGERPEGLGSLFGWDFGLINSTFVSKYVEQCQVSVIEQDFDSKRLRGIRCVHPTRGDLEILFDANMNVTFLSEKLQAGDLVFRSKDDTPGIMEKDSWSMRKMGPFKYGEFQGRKIILEVGLNIRDSYNLNVNSAMKYEGHRSVREKLNGKIIFPELDFQDGQTVHCNGQPDRHYELRDGVAALVVDLTAVEAANRARMIRSTGGRFRFYSVLGFTFIVILGFLVWYRNRGA